MKIQTKTHICDIHWAYTYPHSHVPRTNPHTLFLSHTNIHYLFQSSGTRTHTHTRTRPQAYTQTTLQRNTKIYTYKHMHIMTHSLGLYTSTLARSTHTNSRTWTHTQSTYTDRYSHSFTHAHTDTHTHTQITTHSRWDKNSTNRHQSNCKIEILHKFPWFEHHHGNFVNSAAIWRIKLKQFANQHVSAGGSFPQKLNFSSLI